MTWFTGLLFVVSLLQWRAVRRQGDLMDQALVQTGVAAKAAFDNAKAAMEQAEQVRKQADYMRDGLAETRKAADAAKQSADVAESALLTGQRAFVALQQHNFRPFILLERAPAEGKAPTPPRLHGFHISPIFENWGHTPAKHVRIEFFVFPVKSDAVDEFVYKPTYQTGPETDIGPRQSFAGDSLLGSDERPYFHCPRAGPLGGLTPKARSRIPV